MSQTMNPAGNDSNIPDSTPTSGSRRHYRSLSQRLQSQQSSVLSNTQDEGPSGNIKATGSPSQANGTVRKGEKPFKTKSWLFASVLAIGTVALVAAITMQFMEQLQGKSMCIEQANRLKNLGLAMRIFSATDANAVTALAVGGANSANMLIDPVSGKPFVIVGGDATEPEKVIAYSPWTEGKGGAFLMGDGSVHSLPPREYKAKTLTLSQPAQPITQNPIGK
jgi:hypothetical protein